MDYAGIVSDFLDQAERAGIGHVTYLSAYGMQHAPAEFALRAVELDLLSCSALTHSTIRPGWFMQNFSETFLMPSNGAIVVPNDDVLTVTGRPPLSFTDFAARAALAWK
ncbi:hypothetical protein [Mycolicibacterium komossense]|uniref:NmrA-like domain-containing protein n=1 Tax=Mycolicibacterium komossense TaxID=1779 RepID=A0ABT3CJ02_9MYCO|nr:hypothetical protein [Mycolicibacterium komossense]MCV7229470.1 hypothetical protein [Mycolicibacterium komossense]